MASFSRPVMMIAFRAGDDLLAGVDVAGGAREGRVGDEVYDERGRGRSDRQPSARRNPRNPRTVHGGNRHHTLELVVHGPLLLTLGMPGAGQATGLVLTSTLAPGRAGRARNYPGRCPGLRYWSSRRPVVAAAAAPGQATGEGTSRARHRPLRHSARPTGPASSGQLARHEARGGS